MTLDQIRAASIEDKLSRVEAIISSNYLYLALHILEYLLLCLSIRSETGMEPGEITELIKFRMKQRRKDFGTRNDP